MVYFAGKRVEDGSVEDRLGMAAVEEKNSATIAVACFGG
jgi:hypothetical protein